MRRREHRAVGAAVPGAFLTVREAARRIKVSTATVYRACARGEMPCVRVLNLLRIPEGSQRDHVPAPLHLGPHPPGQVRVRPDRGSLEDDRGERHGQVVITIEVEPIVKTLRAEVTVISAPRMFDVRVRGRAYRVVCTPDLVVGGYAVTVPELPGRFTEGDSVAEVRRMVREAIGLWLDADATPRKARRARAAG